MTSTLTTNTASNINSNDEPVIRRRVAPSRRRRDGLIRFARDRTSQNGEDGIIEKIFELLPPDHDESRGSWCVDVGAWDGIHLSNTYSLLCPEESNQRGSNRGRPRFWRGCLIEADEKKFNDLKSLHGGETGNNVCIHAAVSAMPYSLQQLGVLLKSHAPELPPNFDFLCVDIDGADYWVLEELWGDSVYRPKVVCVEFNPSMPDDLVYIPPRSDILRQGASLAALVELAEQNSYVLIETTIFNAFFIQRELYEKYLVPEVPDTSIEALHEISMGTALYQLYDGTIKLWGCKKLLWHRVAIDEQKLQVLPPDHRNFPFAPTSPNFDEKCVVDIGPICALASNANHQQRQTCADELLTALEKDGFAYVRGTGMSQTLCQDALLEAKSFLSDADESVRRSCLTKDRARRGYSPTCTENFASLVGSHGPNDLVRKFRMGPVDSTETIANDNGKSQTPSSLLQPNVWPGGNVWSQEAAGSFQSTVQQYYEAICLVSNCIVWAIYDAIARKNPEMKRSMNVLAVKDSTARTSILTLLGYRVGTRHKGKHKSPLVAEHTDVGVITVLLFDGPGCAKLQRSDRAGGWVDVNLPSAVPADPIFVVNIGDCLEELSCSSLPSTLHRVSADKNDAPRHTVALFVGLDPDASLVIRGENMTYEEWRKRRIARAQSILKAPAENA